MRRKRDLNRAHWWTQRKGQEEAPVPSWFDLEKYDGLRERGNFTPERWRKHISLRRELLDTIEMGLWRYSDADWLYDLVDQICRDPLNDKHHSVYCGINEQYSIEFSLETSEYSKPEGIRFLTHDRLWRLASWLWNGESEEEIDYAPNLVLLQDFHTFRMRCDGSLFDLEFDGIKSKGVPSERTYDMYDALPNKNCLGKFVQLMAVDLKSPDDILIEQFKEKLAEARRDVPPSEVVYSTRPEYEAWINHGVLPFLDLQLWRNLHSVWIRHQDIAEVIFADGRRGEASVRNTTHQHVDYLMDVSSPQWLGLLMEARQQY